MGYSGQQEEQLEHEKYELSVCVDFYVYAGAFLRSGRTLCRCRSPPLVLRFRMNSKRRTSLWQSHKIPDFRKLYPEASEEVIAVLRTTERKMQYQEYDLKTERTIIDHKTQTVQRRADTWYRKWLHPPFAPFPSAIEKNKKSPSFPLAIPPNLW